MGIQYCLWTWGIASWSVDRDCDKPSVSTQFCLINSNCGDSVGVVQIRGRQTDITKCKKVSVMQPKRFAFLEFLICTVRTLREDQSLRTVANKLNKSRYKSSLNNCAFLFLLTFLVFCWFFPVLFDIGNVSNQLVSALVILFI